MVKSRRLTAAVAALTALLGVAACSGSSGGGDGGGGTQANAKSITVWTTDTLPDRVAATKAIIAGFTQKTGIKVKLVGVAEDQFNQVLTSSAAAGTLPDVMGSLSLSFIRTLSANKLSDPDANAAVVDALGRDTFNKRALELTSEGGKQLAVPSDSWAQLLIYRKDLFDKAGLAAPKTYDDILAAAKALDTKQRAGFVGATTPGDAFTRQTFEEVGLANGCQLVDQSGKIQFGSSQCVNAMKFYGDLIHQYSVPGTQDVDTTRAAYFAGKSAMLIWSSFILDEMAGLRNDAMPSCPECKNDPAYLAKNSGVVTAIQGPDGDKPAAFGEVTSWTIIHGAATESAKKFVEYMMSDGYEDWTAIAPEGKFPVRSGTKDNATLYVDNWKTLPVGVDRKAPLSKFYGNDVLAALSAGPDAFDQWGISQGQGSLVGAMAGELPVAAAVGKVTSGDTDAQTAVKEATDQIQSIQDSLK
jgi:multiple sugar transport system substrate-binding protein